MKSSSSRTHLGIALFALPVGGCTLSMNHPTVLIRGTTPVTALYPKNGANWMDYVANAGGGGKAWNRPDVACTGTEGGYFKCLHGGELRTFQASGLSSCTGLTAQDSLGAFDWVCDSSTGSVTFYSKGLKAGKGLRDLVTSDGPAFRPNSVTVSDSSLRPVFQTTSSVWWGNRLSLLPSGTNPQPLAANTIYVAPTSATINGLYISQVDKVGLVTLGDSLLSYGGVTAQWCREDGSSDPTGTASNAINNVVLCIGGSSAGSPSRFHWIEASLNGMGATAAQGTVEVTGLSLMIRIHRTRVKGYGPGHGFDFSGPGTFGVPNGVLIDDSIAAGGACSSCQDTGFWVRSSPTNLTIMKSVAANSGSTDGFDTTSADVYFQNLVYNNAHGGMGVGEYSVLVGNTVFGNGQSAFFTRNGSTYLANSALNNAPGASGKAFISLFSASVTNLVVSGSGQIGISSGGSATEFTDVLAAYNPKGIQVASGSFPTFNGGLWVGNNTTHCDLVGAGSNLTSAACARGAVNPVSSTADPAASYAGIVTSDLSNQTIGLAFPLTYALNGQEIDWLNFDNPFRGWGLNGSSSPFAAGNVGACQSGSCQLFDFTLNAGDTLLRNVYGSWPGSGICPSSVDPTNAANIIDDMDGRHFLRSAIEMMDPWANPNGNYNGLCEGGETCIFTPNLGSYQGTGDPLATQPCVTRAGSGFGYGVTVYAYPHS